MGYDLPNYFPAEPPMYGQQQQAPQYYAGTDIIIQATLTDNEANVSHNDYFLKATLAIFNGCAPVWQGILNCGLYITNDQLIINIPANITAQLDYRLYYVTVIGQAKADAKHIAVLFNQSISIQELPGNISVPLVQTQLNPPPPPPNPVIDFYMPIEYFSI